MKNGNNAYMLGFATPSTFPQWLQWTDRRKDEKAECNMQSVLHGHNCIIM